MKEVYFDTMKRRVSERAFGEAHHHVAATWISYDYDPGGFLRTAALFMMDENALFANECTVKSQNNAEESGFCHSGNKQHLSSSQRGSGLPQLPHWESNNSGNSKRPRFDQGPISVIVQDQANWNQESERPHRGIIGEDGEIHAVEATDTVLDFEPIPLFEEVERTPVGTIRMREVNTFLKPDIIKKTLEKYQLGVQFSIQPFDSLKGAIASKGKSAAPSMAEIRKNSVPSDWPLEYRLQIARCTTTADLPVQDGKICGANPPKLLKPLNAYNYFFRVERDNLVHKSVGGVFPPVSTDRSNAKMWDLLHQRWWVDPIKAKRKHRKQEGTIPFAT
jgi:hypothetical protein